MANEVEFPLVFLQVAKHTLGYCFSGCLSSNFSQISPVIVLPINSLSHAWIAKMVLWIAFWLPFCPFLSVFQKAVRSIFNNKDWSNILLKLYQCSISNMVLEINWNQIFANHVKHILKASVQFIQFLFWNAYLILDILQVWEIYKHFLLKFELQMISLYCWYLYFLF